MGVEKFGVANRMKFNLQYFAEGEPAPDGGDPASGEPNPSGKDPEKAFAARLGHERKKMEAEYGPYRARLERQAKAAGMNLEEYNKYLDEQAELEELEAEAERTGLMPEVLKERKEREAIQNELKTLQREKALTSEEKALTSDPKIGKFVAEHIDKIREIANGAEVDLRTAMAVVAAEMLPDLLDNANPEKHIQNYIESLKRGGKPIEYGGGATSPQATMPKTFEDARKAAAAMLKNGG